MPLAMYNAHTFLSYLFFLRQGQTNRPCLSLDYLLYTNYNNPSVHSSTCIIDFSPLECCRASGAARCWWYRSASAKISGWEEEDVEFVDCQPEKKKKKKVCFCVWISKGVGLPVAKKIGRGPMSSSWRMELVDWMRVALFFLLLCTVELLLFFIIGHVKCHVTLSLAQVFLFCLAPDRSRPTTRWIPLSCCRTAPDMTERASEREPCTHDGDSSAGQTCSSC